MTLQARRIRHAFDRNYWIGLAFLGFLATVAWLATSELTRFEETRAKTLAIAAGQPTASQRIAFLANAYVGAKTGLERKEYRAELRRTIRDMEAAHNYLTLREKVSRGERRHLKSIQSVYFDGVTPFDDQVRAFLDYGKAVLAAPASELKPDMPALARLNLAGSNFIMQTHGLIVQILQERAEAAVKRTEVIQAGIWLLTLVVLLLEAIFIFAPMGKRIEESIEAIEEAEAEAKAANASKSNFLRVISHEFRTPLNAIAGVAQMLGQRSSAPEDASNIAMLARASDHLVGLTNDVLDFSQLEAGGLELARAPFNLREEVERCTAIAEQLAGEKGLSLRLDIPANTDIWVEGDAPRLRRILLNLLSNAVKFTDAGTVGLSCRVAACTDVDRTVEIAVSDTGVGIAPNARANLFTAYELLDAFETRRHGGAGLGLAIVHQLTKLMGAKIAVDSEAAKGSVFTIRLTLPLAEAVEPEAAPAPAPTARSVLIVEDNIPNQMIAKAFLSANGFDVVIANNGREAIDAVNKQKFDLVLMDINMPVMDGLEATRILRQDPNYRSTPILAFTAHAIDEDQSTILNAGLNDILKKPITEKGLVERVNRWLNPDPPERTAA